MLVRPNTRISQAGDFAVPTRVMLRVPSASTTTTGGLGEYAGEPVARKLAGILALKVLSTAAATAASPSTMAREPASTAASVAVTSADFTMNAYTASTASAPNPAMMGSIRAKINRT